MTFMMTSSNEDKCDMCQFFYQDLFHIVSTVYVQNFMWNGQTFSEIQHVFFNVGLLGLPPALRFWKKPNPGRVKELQIFFKCSETFEKFLAVCNSSKNTGLPQFLFKGFWQLCFRNTNFLTKTKRCLLC